ncbi:MAG: extracellular catalytic domain type 1 short-chain-length polyhydroxyalkanoate depolymerase [Candidatus Flexifilum sp.]|jgi:polyhydroxybutyrate depolymerase
MFVPLRSLSVIALLALFIVGSGSLSAAQTDPTPAPDCAPPRPAAAPGQTIVEGLDVNGVERYYRLYVPASYDPARPTALVMSFHGFASSAAQQESFSGWNAVADEAGFIVVYPQGMGIPARWNSGELFAEGFAQEDDVGFVRALVAHLSETLCIDPARVYANGLSNGAGMSHRLACEASDLVAAIGGVAGAYAPLTCAPERPVPVIAFHGTADRIVPIDGLEGGLGGGALPPIRDWVDGWAERNGCDLSNPIALEPIGAVTGIRYTGCADDAEVIYYVAEGAGHTWPGGSPQPRFIIGEVNRDIDASRLMWAFFAAHPLRPPTDR